MWGYAFILGVLWLLGWISGYTLDGFLHILLMIAILLVIISLVRGKQPIC